MKRLLLTAAMGLMLASCSDKRISKSEVPQAVISTFKDKYPNSSNVEWEEENKKGRSIYEASFRMDGKEIEALFCKDGTFLEEQ